MLNTKQNTSPEWATAPQKAGRGPKFQMNIFRSVFSNWLFVCMSVRPFRRSLFFVYRVFFAVLLVNGVLLRFPCISCLISLWNSSRRMVRKIPFAIRKAACVDRPVSNFKPRVTSQPMICFELWATNANLLVREKRGKYTLQDRPQKPAISTCCISYK